MGGKKTAERKKIAAVEDMKKFMAEYYIELNRASKEGDKKIAWCTSVGPAELLRAMGFLVYFPETHAAMIGASKLASEYIPHSNVLGYSPCVCSYMTSDIGAFTQGFTPLTKAYKTIKSIPRPDVLVYNTNQCRDVKDWFYYYSSYFNVPLFGINSSRGINKIDENSIAFISRQIEDLIEPLQKIIGKKFDYDKFKMTVKISRECSEGWKKVLYTASAIPSPITFFDCTTLMGPAVVGRGTRSASEFYKILLSELNERVNHNVGAVEGELHRIYWDGMPIWGRLRVNSELFAGLKTCVVASTYCNSWIFNSLDSNDPFKSMAKAYTELFIVRGEKAKERYIKEMLEYFRIDGIIYHDSKTCPNNSNNRYGMPLRLEKETGIPSLTIDGDLNDLRFVSDEQTKTKIEAFIEQLEEIN